MDNNLKEIPELALHIERVLRDDCRVHGDRLMFVKVNVAKVEGLKIYINTNDHSPPHFHIKSNNPEIDCSILVEDCSIYREKKKIPSKCLQKLKIWFHDETIVNGETVSGKMMVEKKWSEIHG